MGVAGGIRGTQVKDDSLTGDDINESTLIMPQTYHASGNSGNSNNPYYIAIPGRNGWSNTFTKAQMQLVAPYYGIVTKVFFRPTAADPNSADYFQVRTNGDGNEAKDGATDVVTTSNMATVGVDEGTTELDFTVVGATPAPIPKGHAFSFAIFKGSPGSYGITNATIVIEWDLST